MSGSHCQEFLTLIRLGIGQDVLLTFDDINWTFIRLQSQLQDHNSVVYDGVERLPQVFRPPFTTWLRWIGEVQLEEARYNQQWCEACKMAQLFQQNGIRTFVLKGNVVSECYPKPEHRFSADFDCFLLPDDGSTDVWERGNQLVEGIGYKVERQYYKNSKFLFSGLIVENHRYFTPFRGNKRLKALEGLLQTMIRQDGELDCFDGSCLYRPPVVLSALFFIEHAYSHFLHEGLTWRHVLDWVLFHRKHECEISENELNDYLDEFGLNRFFDSYNKLGRYLLGSVADEDLNDVDKKMLADIWAPRDLHVTVDGFKGKIALVGNTLRARWKYHYFSEISMPHALWIQVRGYLFDRNPKLS